MTPAQPFGRLLGRGLRLCADGTRAEGGRVLVAGLGNYGLRGTRHSVGMAVLNYLASRLNVADQWKRDPHCCADVTIAKLDEVEVVLLKPRRLMNINGLCVRSAADAYDLGVESIYLVHDDLDKPLGKFALKFGGSARGHNGVRSCMNALHSDRMIRLRIGIGRPVGDTSVDHYVLSRFTNEEQEILPQVFEQAVGTLLEHIRKENMDKDTPAMCGKPVNAPP